MYIESSTDHLALNMLKQECFKLEHPLISLLDAHCRRLASPPLHIPAYLSNEDLKPSLRRSQPSASLIPSTMFFTSPYILPLPTAPSRGVTTKFYGAGSPAVLPGRRSWDSWISMHRAAQGHSVPVHPHGRRRRGLEDGR